MGAGCGGGIAQAALPGCSTGCAGRSSNRGHAAEFRALVLKRVEERYADFGPTLASEHLAVDDGLGVARETLRRWLRAAGRPAERKRSAYRKRREPKAHFGELVQMDGSFHRWLEDRGGEGCLMHLVDDATSTALFSFSKEETTWAAANLLRAWKAGVPLVMGTDAGNPLVFHGPSMHHELQLWVQAGIPAEVALQAATVNGAKLLRAASRIGAIRKGLDADLLMVDGNPLQDIAATERISLVMFKGERLRRPELFDQK